LFKEVKEWEFWQQPFTVRCQANAQELIHPIFVCLSPLTIRPLSHAENSIVPVLVVRNISKCTAVQTHQMPPYEVSKEK